ncbi:MAG: hypothetical protein OXF84_07045 [Bacteroidetes bacterium]|nr:hypothetical protein [Bacteroidota bacterium]
MKRWLVGDFGEMHILVAEYSLDYASTQAFIHQPDKKPKAIAMKLIVKSEMGKVQGTTSCWVSDDYSIEMCSPTPVGMPESGECVETRTIEVTCVLSHDGGGGCTICGGSGGGGGGSGNGGGGGGCTSCGDNGDSNDLPKPGDQDEGNKEQLRLVCDESVQRGSTGGCKIISKNESIQVKSYTFTWSSSLGGSNNTYGWVGTATETVKITVKASTGWTKTAEIKVTDRDWPGPSGKLNITPMYTSEPRSRSSTVVGLYRLVAETKLDESISHGSGPWAGRFYIGYAPSIQGELHVAKDFDTRPSQRSSLPEYSLNGTLCPPVIQSGVSSASYWYVNSKCGRLSAVEGFRLEIIQHEKEHAAGYQQCLDSPTTKQLFKDLEKVTGTRADVTFHSSNNQGMWRVFLRKLLASGHWASAVNYSKAFYQYHTEWVYAMPSGGGHSGSNTPC